MSRLAYVCFELTGGGLISALSIPNKPLNPYLVWHYNAGCEQHVPALILFMVVKTFWCVE